MIKPRTRTIFDRQQQREMLRRAADRAEDKRFRDRRQWHTPFWDLQPAWLAPMMLSCTLVEEYARLYGSDEGWERI